MPGNSIRNTPKHRNRHLQDRSTYLQISKCNLFLIPSSCTPPRCGEGSLSRGGQKLAAHPRSGSPLCVPPPAGQVGALMGGCPCAVPCTPRPTTGEKAPCPRGMADPLWGKVCARNLFGILCLLINFADGCLPLWSDQRGAKALLGAPPPHHPDIHRAYSHFPILSAVVTGAFLFVKGQRRPHLHEVWVEVWDRAFPATIGKTEAGWIQKSQESFSENISGLTAYCLYCYADTSQGI